MHVTAGQGNAIGKRSRKRRLALPVGALIGAAALAIPLGSASAAPPAEQTVYEYLEDRPRQYSTYLNLAERAGITRFLRAPKDRTWIIPTNAAFRQVADHRLRSLRSRANRQQLARELMTGVLEGDRSPAQLRRGIGQRIRSIFGSPARISAGEGNLELNHGAKISRTGTRVDNGVVYATNTALLKPDRTRSGGFVDGAELTGAGSCSVVSGTTADGAANNQVQCRPPTASGDYVVNLENVVDAANTTLGATVANDQTMLWIVGIGGRGGAGASWKNGPGGGADPVGGAGGKGGSGAFFTSIESLRSKHGTTSVYYYVGRAGENRDDAASSSATSGQGGGAGAASIVSLEAPPSPTNWVPPPLSEILAIGGSGAGGGSAGDMHAGAAGGEGGKAVSTASAAGSTFGANGSGGSQSTGGRGGGNGQVAEAVTGDCASSSRISGENWCSGKGGIGGFGAPHTINGGSADGVGWLNKAFFTQTNIDNKSVRYELTPGVGGIGQGNNKNCNEGGGSGQACGGAGGAGYGGGSAGKPEDATAQLPFGSIVSQRNGGGGGGGGSFAQVATCTPAATASATPAGDTTSTGDGTFHVIVVANASGATTCK